MLPHLTEIILILVIVAIVFGFGRLSSLPARLSEARQSFKKSLEPEAAEPPIDITPVGDARTSKRYDPKPGTTPPDESTAEVIDPKPSQE